MIWMSLVWTLCVYITQHADQWHKMFILPIASIHILLYYNTVRTEVQTVSKVDENIFSVIKSGALKMPDLTTTDQLLEAFGRQLWVSFVAAIAILWAVEAANVITRTLLESSGHEQRDKHGYRHLMTLIYAHLSFQHSAMENSPYTVIRKRPKVQDLTMMDQWHDNLSTNSCMPIRNNYIV